MTRSTLETGDFDPRAMILLFVSVAAWVMTTATLVGAIVWLAAITAGVVVAGRISTESHSCWSLLRFSLPFALLVFGFHVLTLSTGSILWQVGPVSITNDGVHQGAHLACRLLAFVGLAAIIRSILSPAGLAAGLTRLLSPLGTLGIPVASLYHLVLFTSRMLSVLVDEARIIRFGQRSRGIRFDGGWRSRVHSSLALAVPVFAAAMRRSERLSLALASRGFDPSRIPHVVLEMRFARRDWLMVGLTVVGWIAWYLTTTGLIEGKGA